MYASSLVLKELDIVFCENETDREKGTVVSKQLTEYLGKQQGGLESNFLHVKLLKGKKL